MATDGKTILSIDFDKTIHRYSEGWADGDVYDPPEPGAVSALTRLAEDFELVVHTARTDFDAVWQWLEDWGIDDLFTDVSNVKNGRSAAFVDDKGVNYNGSWADTLDAIGELTGWDPGD